MNRLQRLLNDRLARPPQPAVSGRSQEVIDDLGLDSESPRLGFPFQLFVPQHFEPRYEYPLVVWLHSDHSSECELELVMPATSVRNYLAIAPRGPRASNRSARLFRWGTQLSDLAVAEDFVLDAIDEALDKLPVHSDRIFLAGCGTAGTVAQWIGLKNSHRFAGVVSINGPFPKQRRALSDWKRSRGLPVLFMNECGSARCSQEQLVDAMHTAHSSGLAYRFLRFEGAESITEFGPSIIGNDGGTESSCCALSCQEGGRAVGRGRKGGREELSLEVFAAMNRFLMGIVTQTELPLTPAACDDAPDSPAFSAKSFGWN
jgi:phospholipase/carboxylesterase